MADEKSFVEKAELCLRTVEDNVNFALSLMRAAKFNRHDESEHHREVVLARMREVRAFAMNWAMAADANREIESQQS
jgi:hypothetical protein